ncbi:hypothetical protein K466DRAFT_139326 [Polyporus arcularius HHB13444]|uniref:Uncharacterized protein n=1 Tax=Polyporus arcularius HHB13444 TaxID=1314778 RepID=A0A5C3PC49_9APHY|nr:hypothetical protein K466DRAFT_139326 [Polyporus arcularius HHB13444]
MMRWAEAVAGICANIIVWSASVLLSCYGHRGAREDKEEKRIESSLPLATSHTLSRRPPPPTNDLPNGERAPPAPGPNQEASLGRYRRSADAITRCRRDGQIGGVREGDLPTQRLFDKSSAMNCGAIWATSTAMALTDNGRAASVHRICPPCPGSCRHPRRQSWPLQRRRGSRLRPSQLLSETARHRRRAARKVRADTPGAIADPSPEAP